MSKFAKTKSRLGRGLSSLISVSDLPVEQELPAPETGVDSISPADANDSDGLTAVQVIDVPVEKVQPNPHQPRREFDETSIAELATSLKTTGLIQPIVVRRTETGYELIAGERRLRAAKLAKLETLPAMVREVDGLTQAQMALVENVQRQDLNPIDRASAYRMLIDQLGLTQAELAGRLGEERTSITNYLRLLELAEPVRRMLADGRISLGHGKLLAGVSPSAGQERLANLVVTQGLSVRNLERLVASPPAESTTEDPGPRKESAHIPALETSLSRQLGLRVQLRTGAKKGKGRLILHYATLDQFDELLGRLGVTADE